MDLTKQLRGKQKPKCVNRSPAEMIGVAMEAVAQEEELIWSPRVAVVNEIANQFDSFFRWAPQNQKLC